MLSPRQRIEVALQTAKQQVHELELALKEMPSDQEQEVSAEVAKYAHRVERSIIRKKTKKLK
jgi:hypothetical protein